MCPSKAKHGQVVLVAGQPRVLCQLESALCRVHRANRTCGFFRRTKAGADDRCKTPQAAVNSQHDRQSRTVVLFQIQQLPARKHFGVAWPRRSQTQDSASEHRAAASDFLLHVREPRLRAGCLLRADSRVWQYAGLFAVHDILPETALRPDHTQRRINLAVQGTSPRVCRRHRDWFVVRADWRGPKAGHRRSDCRTGGADVRVAATIRRGDATRRTDGLHGADLL